MPNINFNIIDGIPPFEVELIGSTIPKIIYNNAGAYSIDGIDNGVYILKIIDANECIYEKEIIVDPSVTTTTTTKIPGKSIVIGHTQDPILIFNPNGTNRNSEYNGYPDSDIVTLYLWFKTYNGKPLDNNILLNYEIISSDQNINSTFEFNSVTDEIHCEVIENTSGINNVIDGNIILKNGFIESAFKYTYNKTINKRFEIEIQSSLDNIYPNLQTKLDAETTYGITSINSGGIILNY